MHPHIHGLVAAPFTPFQSNFELNLEIIPPYAKFLKERGVVAAFVCGSTGEGPSLTLDERMAVAETWIGCVDRDFLVIVHAGHTCLKDACLLARHAASAGASAVSCIAPYFFKPDDVDALVSWCEKVAASAQPLPFYFYHIPSMTGVEFCMKEFLCKAAERIPTFAGIKFTHNDLEEYSGCLQFEAGKYDLLFGRDEILIDALRRGAKGAVGSTYNFASPLYARLIDAFERGDVEAAEDMQAQALSLIHVCCDSGVSYLAAAKSVMRFLGIDCGPVRPPMHNPSPSQLDKLRKNLDDQNLFPLLSPCFKYQQS